MNKFIVYTLCALSIATPCFAAKFSRSKHVPAHSETQITSFLDLATRSDLSLTDTKAIIRYLLATNKNPFEPNKEGKTFFELATAKSRDLLKDILADREINGEGAPTLTK